MIPPNRHQGKPLRLGPRAQGHARAGDETGEPHIHGCIRTRRGQGERRQPYIVGIGELLLDA